MTMRKIKLCFITSYFPNIKSGVADYTYHLSNALLNQEIEIFVLTSDDERIIKNNDLNILSVIKKWNIFAIPKLVKTINQIKPDILSFQYVPYSYNDYGMPVWIVPFLIVLKSFGYKIIITFHEVAIRLDYGKPKYLIIGIVQRLIAYALVVISNKIVTSNKQFSGILKFSKNKICLVPVGSNILPLEVSDEEKRYIKSELAPNGETLISTFGSHTGMNHLLLDVAKKLTENGYKIKLLFIGGMPNDFINAQTKRAKELGVNIFFTDFMTSQDVFKYLSVSDLFVILEYVNEKGWGGACIKSASLAAAYAASLPIISNRGDLTDDFFQDGKNILFVSSLKIDDICQAVSSLVNDLNLKTKLVHNTKETYKRYLDWNIIAGRYKDLFVMPK